MLDKLELKQQIALAIDSRQLDNLYSWLMQRNWNIHQHSDQGTRDLVSEVELLFFDMCF